MEKEAIIKKWLNDELTPQEFEQFKNFEDYDDLIKLSNSMKLFKADGFNNDLELDKLLKTVQLQKNKKSNWQTSFLRIAAVIALCFGAYYFLQTNNTKVNTLAAEKTTIELPDGSKTILNARTSIEYNKNLWDESRDVSLDGEAFFKVSKGSSFTVKTVDGDIVVLGTQFNVKQRDNYFEVTCYEGSVKVIRKKTSVTLHVGDQFLIRNENIKSRQFKHEIAPSWIENKSSFTSAPYIEVLDEFERQFNVTLETKNVDLTMRFTGSFDHDDQLIALKSICMPMHLKYKILNEKNIVLSRE